MNDQQRLVIISNRLPIVVQETEKGYSVAPGSGGLVTALAPVLRNRGGVWIGWPGIADVPEKDLAPFIEEGTKSSGFTFDPVYLSQKEVKNFYYGFSNEVIWPLFHDLQAQCNFNPLYWKTYQEVNSKFADKVIDSTKEEDFIWVHDYQLLLLGQELRKRDRNSKIAFFLHIPFPPLDIFLKLPWRFEIIRAMLEYDLVGFQTMRDRRNFIQCVRTLLKDVHQESSGSLHVYHVGHRRVRVGSFPISIDYNEFVEHAETREVAQRASDIHEAPGRKFVLSVDRLDYTKGITYRLKAIRTLLEKHPELRKKITFVQVVVPSRLEIDQYQKLKVKIDRLVGEINSEFTEEEWVPIHYMYRNLSRKELLAYYRTSEIALVTPIKDGMNLVSKEYVASNIEEDGVLVLSEFAGSASQMHQDAVLVNPYDIEGLAEAIHTAYTMEPAERKERMKKMRRNLKRADIFGWVRSFLNAAISKELVDFPIDQEYIPDEKELLSL